MQASNLILLWIVFFQSQRVKGIENVSLKCKPQAVSGPNLTIDCHINSTNAPYFCNLHGLSCYYNGSEMLCGVKKKEPATENNKISNVIIEIYNVTDSGTYTLKMNTDCGHLISHSVVNLTEIKTDRLVPYQVQSPDNTKIHGLALWVGLSVSVIVVLVGVVGTCVYKQRRKASGYQPPTNNLDPEVGPG